MAKFKVMKPNADHPGRPATQCGGVVKTLRKAIDLRNRMRAQQPPGSSNWFIIENA